MILVEKSSMWIKAAPYSKSRQTLNGANPLGYNVHRSLFAHFSKHWKAGDRARSSIRDIWCRWADSNVAVLSLVTPTQTGGYQSIQTRFWGLKRSNSGLLKISMRGSVDRYPPLPTHFKESFGLARIFNIAFNALCEFILILLRSSVWVHTCFYPARFWCLIE